MIQLRITILEALNSFARIKSISCLTVLLLSMLYHVVPHSHHETEIGNSGIRMSFGPSHSVSSTADLGPKSCHKGSLLHFFLCCHGDDNCDSHEFLELQATEILSSKIEIPSLLTILTGLPHLLLGDTEGETLAHVDCFDFSLVDDVGKVCAPLRGPPSQIYALS
jgi:hypothetical protein